MDKADADIPVQRADGVVLAAALAWGVGVGPAGFRKLVAGCGSLPAVFHANSAVLQAAEPRLTAQQMEAIASLSQQLGEFADRIRRLQQSGVQVLSSDAEQYPQSFAALRNPPPVLCVKGSLLDRDRAAVAIVGTRSPRPDEIVRTSSLVRAFVASGITVVSGLAAGIDGATHRAALRAGGRTIAVLGSGLDWIYPPEHTDLAEQVAQSGALLSELAPETRVAVGTLMARNRLIAALGAATVVVASGNSGGSLVTATEAGRLGKPVAAVTWASTAQLRPGNRLLLEEGAIPVDDDNVAALCDIIHASPAGPHLTESPSPPDGHNPQLGLFG